MQIKILFKTDMLNLPISYNSILQGFIYNTLLKADPEFSSFLHNKSNSEKQNLTKFFSFGRLHGNYTVRQLNIIFPHSASLEIRSPDYSFVQCFLKGCSSGEQIRLGHNSVTVESCILEDRIIFDNCVLAHTETPFTFHSTFEESKQFDGENIRKKLIENAYRKWYLFGYDPAEFELDIIWKSTSPKLVHSIFKKTYVNGWDTEFYLSGNPETINFIYNSGIGSKNSQGYGMVSI